MNTEKPTIYKNILWKVDNIEHLEIIEEAGKLAIAKGLSIGDMMHDALTRFCKRYRKPFPMHYEYEFLEILASNGVILTRQTLRNYREKKVLQNKRGVKYWRSDGHSVIYYTEKCLEIIKKRCNGSKQETESSENGGSLSKR